MAPEAEKKPAEEKPASEKPVEEKAPAEKKPKAGRKLSEEAGADVDTKKKMKKMSIETCQKTLERESMAPEAEKKPASEKPVEEKPEAEEADPVPEWIRTYEAQELQLKENPYWELITESSDKKLIGKYRRKASEKPVEEKEPDYAQILEAQELQLKENPYWELITEPSDMNVGKWRPRQSPNSPDPQLLN